MFRKLLSLFALLFFVMTSIAQEAEEAPLIAYFNGQMYILDTDTLVEYDDCMPDEEIIGQFIPSPDGRQFLIATFPKIISEAFAEFGSLGDIAYGSNYWLCDTNTNTLERIIVQPNADDPFEGELPSLDTVQGQLSWSPDGSQVAWTQLSFLDDIQSIITLNPETQETTSFAIDVPLAPFPSPVELIAWTEEGILVWTFEFNEETFFNVESLAVIDIDTQSISATYEILNDGESSDFIQRREVVQVQETFFYAIEFSEQGWMLIDISTGEMLAVEGSLALIETENTSSITAISEQDENFSFNWTVNSSEANTQLDGYPPERIALSSDGTQLAYADSTLHIYQENGDILDVSNSDGFADDFAAKVIWGRTNYTFLTDDLASGENIQSETLSSNECEDAPPNRVMSGDIAEVISASIPNRIRHDPTLMGSIVGQIPSNEPFNILDAFACADGYSWVEIEYNGIVGWTVEGRGSDYFIEPIQP